MTDADFLRIVTGFDVVPSLVNPRGCFAIGTVDGVRVRIGLNPNG